MPRVDVTLAIGSINESVTVSASASLLNTENVLSAYVISKEALVETPGVVGVLGQAGFHIQGQNQNDIGSSMDRISSKSPMTGTVNQVDGVN